MRRQLTHPIRATRVHVLGSAWRVRLCAGGTFAIAIMARYQRRMQRSFGARRMVRTGPTRCLPARQIIRLRETRPTVRVNVTFPTTVRTRLQRLPLIRSSRRVKVDAPRATEQRPALSLVQRLVTQAQRVVTSATIRETLRIAVERRHGRPGSNRPLGPIPTLPQLKPVPMVVRKPHVPKVESAPEPQPAINMREASASRSFPSFGRSASATPTPLLDPKELGRVTDHVLRTIERRSVVFRERRGRV